MRDVEGPSRSSRWPTICRALADATLSCALRWAWKHLKTAHRSEPKVAVIAYASSAARSSAIGSDLDVVFVYDDPETEADKAARVYAASCAS